MAPRSPSEEVSLTMDIPTRHVETQWGVLYASAPDTGKVRFSTEPPTPGDPVRPLSIHRLEYSCHLEVSLTEPKGRGRVHIDDIWHFDPHEAITNLRRHPDGGAPTMTAQSTLQRDVVPTLTQWLYSPDGVSMLQEASQYQLALRAERHASIEQLLQDALDRVRHLTAPVVAGLTIDPADERFLDYLTTEFRHVAGRETEATAPGHAPPADRATSHPSERSARSRQRQAEAFAAKFSADTLGQGEWRQPTDDAFAEVFANCARPPGADLYPAIRATFLADFAPETMRDGLDYQTRCRLAATAQGLDPIIERLNDAGIPHSVEQTGGWVMVIEIPVTDHTYIGVTADAAQPDHWVVVRYADPEDVGEPLVASHGFEVPPESAIAAIQQHISDATQQHQSPADYLRRRLDAAPDPDPPGPCL
jgi:hypothetical protein